MNFISQNFKVDIFRIQMYYCRKLFRVTTYMSFILVIDIYNCESYCLLAIEILDSNIMIVQSIDKYVAEEIKQMHETADTHYSYSINSP